MKWLYKLLGLSGTKVINNTLNSFTKVISNLKKGVEMCSKEILEKQESISKTNVEITELSDIVAKAEKMTSNLEKLMK